MPSARILIIDDEQLIRWTLRQHLESEGHEVLEADTAAAGLEGCQQDVDVVLLDIQLPDGNGVELLGEMKELDPDLVVIMMTAFSSVESAVDAMKLGAFHYANKPVNPEEIQLLVQKALETRRLKRQVVAWRAAGRGPAEFDQVLGSSPAMTTLKTMLTKIAASPGSTVLLTGESGTGKGLTAKAIHAASDRTDGPFQNITCSAIPEQLLESELFGHERGAFTDAKERKLGLLELADGGTVFLDEIGEMTAALQAKLLRFLEDKSFRRVGGSTDISVDVRVIAATNRDLQAAVRGGEFREDLFYRLQVLPVVLPPLRERGEDIELLATSFAETFGREFKKPIDGLTAEALQLLESHSWPGNVRELRNAVERAVLLTESAELSAADFLALGHQGGLGEGAAGFRLPAGGIELEALEKDLVRQALERTDGNQTRAAALLGLNRDQIRYRLDKFDLRRPPRGAD
ncbi:MAG: sigma-54 dependent transcriptional regulator [Acidobacteriota bacterium]